MIQIGHPSDAFDLHSVLGWRSYQGDAFLTLSDQAESNALTDVSLPASPYDLQAWQFKYFDFGIDVPQPGYPQVVTLTLGGDIDRFYVVPEPSALLLLLGGVMLIGRKR